MNAQARTQLYRAIRLFLLQFATIFAAFGTDHISREALIAAVVTALEVVWRQVNPAIPADTPNVP